MFLLVFLSVVISVYGRPDGAPLSACSTLMPVHAGLQAQSTKAPYSVTVQEIGNSKYLVKITSSGEPFKGFVLQARVSQRPQIFVDGKFTSSEVSKAINCFDDKNNTLTHVNTDPKNEVITEWMPSQADYLPEDIIFRATVAKEFDKFWTDIDSSVVRSFDKRLNDPSIAGNCFVTEGCFGLPAGCVNHGDCKILLRYSKASDGMHFAIHSYIQTSHYMAMALSKDKIMGDDSVTECIRDGTNPILRYSWNEGKSNTRTRELPKENFMSTFSDGLSTCMWSEPFLFERNEQSYDFMNMQYHILIATGEVEGSELQYHSSGKTFTATPVNFTEYGVNTTGASTIFRVPDMPHSDKGTAGEKDASFEQMTTEAEIEVTTGSGCGSGFSVSLITLVIFGMLHATKEILRVLA